MNLLSYGMRQLGIKKKILYFSYRSGETEVESGFSSPPTERPSQEGSCIEANI